MSGSKAKHCIFVSVSVKVAINLLKFNLTKVDPGASSPSLAEAVTASNVILLKRLNITKN